MSIACACRSVRPAETAIWYCVAAIRSLCGIRIATESPLKKEIATGVACVEPWAKSWSPFFTSDSTMLSENCTAIAALSETSLVPSAGATRWTFGGSRARRAPTNIAFSASPPPVPGLKPPSPLLPFLAPKSGPRGPPFQQAGRRTAAATAATASANQDRNERWAIERKSLSCRGLSARS
jgi:hypothetical protein